MTAISITQCKVFNYVGLESIPINIQTQVVEDYDNGPSATTLCKWPTSIILNLTESGMKQFENREKTDFKIGNCCIRHITKNIFVATGITPEDWRLSYQIREIHRGSITNRAFEVVKSLPWISSIEPSQSLHPSSKSQLK